MGVVGGVGGRGIIWFKALEWFIRDERREMVILSYIIYRQLRHAYYLV